MGSHLNGGDGQDLNTIQILNYDSWTALGKRLKYHGLEM